jgi:sulfur carrier protein ThiS
VKITVKMVAIRPPAPANSERVIALPDGAVVADALSQLGLAHPDSHATLLNDDTVPSGARATTVLKADDTLTIFPPMKGG